MVKDYLKYFKDFMAVDPSYKATPFLGFIIKVLKKKPGQEAERQR